MKLFLIDKFKKMLLKERTALFIFEIVRSSQKLDLHKVEMSFNLRKVKTATIIIVVAIIFNVNKA